MHFVAGGAELGVAHERLQEGLAVRLGVEIGQKRRDGADGTTLARCELVKGRIFHHEITVAHGAAYVNDGMARHAAESRSRFRCVDLL